MSGTRRDGKRPAAAVAHNYDLDDIFAAPGQAGATEMENAREIEVARLTPNPFQPRTEFDPDKLRQLADSLSRRRVLQPLLGRPHPDDPALYQIAAGERRWRAAQLAGLTTVPCVMEDLDDDAMEEIALAENIQREDLSPIDEAAALKRLMQRRGLSLRDVAGLIDKSHVYVTQRLRLLDNPDITEAVRSGALSPTVALSVDRVAEPARGDLLKRAQAGEHITVEEARAARTAAGQAHAQPEVLNNLTAESPRPAPLAAATTTPVAPPSPPPSSSPVLNNLTAPPPMAPRTTPATTEERPTLPVKAGSVLNNLTPSATADDDLSSLLDAVIGDRFAVAIEELVLRVASVVTSAPPDEQQQLQDLAGEYKTALLLIVDTYLKP